MPHTHLNSSLSALLFTPGSSSGPSIVNVLPDPVWPESVEGIIVCKRGARNTFVCRKQAATVVQGGGLQGSIKGSVLWETLSWPTLTVRHDGDVESI